MLILGLACFLAFPKLSAAAQPGPSEFQGTLADLPEEAQFSITNQLAKLTASEGQPGDYFGFSVAMSGNTVVVGAPYSKIGDNGYEGAAYVFVKPASGWANVTETAKLTASDGITNSDLGLAVAINGGTIAVEAGYGNPVHAAVYIYVAPLSGWANMTETAKLNTPLDYSGGGHPPSLAISGNTVVLGMPWGSIRGTFSGVAYVFVEPAGGWTNMAAPTAQLTTAIPPTYFGTSVAISGNTIVVSGPYLQSVFVYTRPPKNGWFGTRTEDADLSASNGDPLATVSIVGDTIAVGSPGATIGSNAGQGAVYVFVKPASGWTSMTQTAKLTASDGAANNGLGDSVAVGANGNEISAGASGWDSSTGAIYTFVKSSTGWANMTQTAEFAASDGVSGNDLGDALSMSGIQTVAGAPQVSISEPGAAYVFSAPR
jgi:hypothetical protein